MPEVSPYNAPPVIRALFAVSQALDAAATPATSSKRSSSPPNTGKPWTDEVDGQLLEAFDRGDDLKMIAGQLGRTRLGIEQRLIKLGKIAAPGGSRSATSARTGPS